MFYTKMNRSILIVLAASLVSCSEYQKVLKEDDVKTKYEMTEKLYDAGEYRKALRLLDQIVPNYIGKPQGERLVYFYADSYYQTEQYYLAAYQYERFTKSYPNSEKAELAAFRGAESEYKTAPRYSLDQTETDKALFRLQNFINDYPQSDYMDEVNAMINELRLKLEKKDYEIARQYYRISDYFAAAKSFELFLKEHPGSELKEDALFYQLKTNFDLAMNSVLSRRAERLENALENYAQLMASFPETKYKEEVESLKVQMENELQQLTS